MMCVHLVNGMLMRAAPDGVSLEDYRETVLSLDTLFLSLQFVDRTVHTTHSESISLLLGS